MPFEFSHMSYLEKINKQMNGNKNFTFGLSDELAVTRREGEKMGKSGKRNQ